MYQCDLGACARTFQVWVEEVKLNECDTNKCKLMMQTKCFLLWVDTKPPQKNLYELQKGWWESHTQCKEIINI